MTDAKDIKQPINQSSDVQILSDKRIKLISKEGVSYAIDLAFANISKLVSEAFEDPTANELHVNVPSEHLNVIIKYMNECKGVSPKIALPPLKEDEKDKKNDFKVNTSQFEYQLIADFGVHDLDTKENKFVLKEVKKVYNLMEYANYMDINSLIHLCGMAVGICCKGYTESQLCKVLGLPFSKYTRKNRPKYVPGKSGKEALYDSNGILLPSSDEKQS